MPIVEDYYNLATDCVVRAKLSADPKTRDMFLHMAEVWTRIAREDDELEPQQQSKTDR